MRFLKYIGVSFITLLLLFVVFGLFQDRQVSVSRTVLIDAEMTEVFDQFNNLEKRVKWSPWEKQDSTMVISMGEITKGAGASYSWKSEDSGDGNLRYKEVIDAQLIESEVFFGMTKDDAPSQELIIFKQMKDGVRVTWEIHMDMGANPFMRLMGRYMDELIGPTLDSGLESIKEITETNA